MPTCTGTNRLWWLGATLQYLLGCASLLLWQPAEEKTCWDQIHLHIGDCRVLPKDSHREEDHNHCRTASNHMRVKQESKHFEYVLEGMRVMKINVHTKLGGQSTCIVKADFKVWTASICFLRLSTASLTVIPWRSIYTWWQINVLHSFLASISQLAGNKLNAVLWTYSISKFTNSQKNGFTKRIVVQMFTLLDYGLFQFNHWNIVSRSNSVPKFEDQCPVSKVLKTKDCYFQLPGLVSAILLGTHPACEGLQKGTYPDFVCDSIVWCLESFLIALLTHLLYSLPALMNSIPKLPRVLGISYKPSTANSECLNNLVVQTLPLLKNLISSQPTIGIGDDRYHIEAYHA